MALALCLQFAPPGAGHGRGRAYVGGLPDMTSAMGGGRGSPKSRRKERGCVNYVHDRGKGVKKFEHFADIIYGSTLM